MIKRHPLNLFIVVFGFILFLQAPPASAEDGCPAGEWPHGTRGYGNPLGCIPRPDLVQQQQQQQQQGPQQQWVNSHYAVAGHDGANQDWVAAGYRNANAASYDALQACNAAMGSGCKIYFDGYNGAFVILRDNLGDRWWGSGATVVDARSKAFGACEKEGLSCVEIQWVTSNAWTEDIGGPRRDQPKVYAPQGDNFRRIYGAAAWVTDEKKAIFKVWFSGNHPTAEAANAAVLSSCTKDSGEACNVVKTLSDAAIFIGLDEASRVRVGTAVSVEASPQQIEANCKKTNNICKLTESFMAWHKGTWVHDPVTGQSQPSSNSVN
jgi:hypothetical protein